MLNGASFDVVYYRISWYVKEYEYGWVRIMQKRAKMR